MSIKPMYIIFIGAIISTIGGIVLGYGTLKHNIASSEKSDSIKVTGEKSFLNINRLQGQNIELQKTIDNLERELNHQSKVVERKNEELLVKSNKIISSQTELNDANNQIQSLQGEVFNHLTGKNSKPIVTASTIAHKLQLYIYNNGAYTVSEIKITYRNIFLLESGELGPIEMHKHDTKFFDKIKETIEWPTLVGNRRHQLIKIFEIPPNLLNLTYAIDFSVRWNNGEYKLTVTLKGASIKSMEYFLMPNNIPFKP